MFQPIEQSHPLFVLNQTKICAVSRGHAREEIIPIAEALFRGGVKVIEITLNTPQALAMIFDMRSHFQDRMIIGAGTVRTPFEADEAFRAGAQFLVTPHTDVKIIERATTHQQPIINGAMTPTEIWTAWQAGATAIKLFPVKSNWETYLQELQGPFPEIPFVVMGGINASNLSKALSLGVLGVGIGGELFPKEAIQSKEYHAIEKAAKHLIKAHQHYVKHK